MATKQQYDVAGRRSAGSRWWIDGQWVTDPLLARKPPFFQVRTLTPSEISELQRIDPDFRPEPGDGGILPDRTRDKLTAFLTGKCGISLGETVKLSLGQVLAMKNEASDTQPQDQPAQPPKPKFQWMAEAMLLVKEHPEWADMKIAGAVGVDRSQLCRCNEYQFAAALVRGQKTDIPAGHRTTNPETGFSDGVDAVD